MDYQKLDPRAIKMWRFGRIIGLIILVAVFAAGLYMTGRVYRQQNLLDLMPLTAAVAIVPILLQILNLLVYPLVEYRQWAYLITADRIEIRKGIFFHSTRIIPISRIQHVTVSEGPLARHYHLASITIHTAGGSIKIEGLARETAEEICDNLKSVVNRKAGFSQTSIGG